MNINLSFGSWGFSPRCAYSEFLRIRSGTRSSESSNPNDLAAFGASSFENLIEAEIAEVGEAIGVQIGAHSRFCGSVKSLRIGHSRAVSAERSTGKHECTRGWNYFLGSMVIRYQPCKLTIAWARLGRVGEASRSHYYSPRL